MDVHATDSVGVYVRKICSVPLLPSNDDVNIDVMESLGVDEPLVPFLLQEPGPLPRDPLLGLLPDGPSVSGPS